jgi:hypothetical protein
MKLAGWLIGIACAVGIVSADSKAFSQPAKEVAQRPESQWSTIETYCFGCHNRAVGAGNLFLNELTAASVSEHPEIFEKAVRKLRGRQMPPPGFPQPSQQEVDALIGWLEGTLDKGSTGHLAGHVPVERLNRTEYANAVKDLLAVEIDATQYLPADIAVEGFSNIAAALTVSPAFLEQYVNVARVVAHMAVGKPEPDLVKASFPPPSGDQDGYVDGMPLGTRGGTRFEYLFPADGEYRFTITDLDFGLYPRGAENETAVVVLVDRKEVFRQKVGGGADRAFVDRGGGAPAGEKLMERFANIPVQVTAGVHEVVVTFIERSRVATDDLIASGNQYSGFLIKGYLRLPRLMGSIKLAGPYAATSPMRTPSREKLFSICKPEVPERERACAERIARDLAGRAFRRPVTKQDIDGLMAFYDAGREGPGGFNAGMEGLVTAVLVSPDFLYRGIAQPKDGKKQFFALSDLELASRLSFFLWRRAPDDELLKLANKGELQRPPVLDAQVRRMLAAPQAESLVTDFAFRWLDLLEVNKFEWDKQLFPEFNAELRSDFMTEIELFLRSVLLEDKNVEQLLTADYTFLDERLAKHYGIPTVHGAQFRRVHLDDENRYGLLGKGAVLLHTSYGNRTSIVVRGAWVLDKLKGTPPAPPPPNVVTDLSTPPGAAPKTLRAMLELHRANPTCNMCHGVIEPHGIPLEHFTVTGQWRDVDWQANAPIDSKVTMPDGKELDSPADLRRALLSRPGGFVQALTTRLMMYALGREISPYDMPQVRAIVRDAAKNDYRLSSLVLGIVSSDAFRMQALEE